MKNVNLYPLQERHVHLHKFIRGLFWSSEDFIQYINYVPVVHFSQRCPYLDHFVSRFYLNGSFLIIYSVE